VDDNERGRESVDNVFFLFPIHMTDCVFIFTHCNINVILGLIVTNNIRNELVMIATHYRKGIKLEHNINHH